MRRYGQPASPERTKVWVEPHPKHHDQQQGRKVPVVYYLSKNRHLEHPHFIEVPLSSNEGLYLRDVINRLNVLRGKKMAGLYSWSCKRSYKNGYVWHDLADDDLILPVHGDEYVLKGSELLDQSPPDRRHSGVSNPKIQNGKHRLPDSPISSKLDDASSSSSPTAIVTGTQKVQSLSTRPPSPLLEPIQTRLSPSAQEYELSPSAYRRGSSEELSPAPIGKAALSSAVGSPSARRGEMIKTAAPQDASTQTEDAGKTNDVLNTRMVGVSTDEGSSDVEYKENEIKHISQTKLVPKIAVDKRSPPPTSSSASSFCGKSSTLESLIRDEISKRNSFRIVEEEVFVPTKAKLKATNMLMQLISCGSISAKDHYSFGFVPTYRPKFNSVELPSPLVSNSVVLDELNYLSKSQRVMGLREQEKDYLDRNGANRTAAADGTSTLQQLSSYDKERKSNVPDFKRNTEEEVRVIHSRRLPRTMNIAQCKHSTNDISEMPMSPVQSIGMSKAGSASFISSPVSSSKVGSKRIIDSSSVKDSSMRFESLREEKEKVVKIEERLTSGARVVIQSRSPCYDEDSLE